MIRVSSMVAILVVTGCGDPIAQSSEEPSEGEVPTAIREWAPGTFTPTSTTEGVSPRTLEWLDRTRALVDEGVGLAVHEGPRGDGATWLIHDPALAERGLPPNWIVRGGESHVADLPVLEMLLARLRIRGEDGRVVAALYADGRTVDHLSGAVTYSSERRRVIDSPARMSLDAAGSDATVELPVIGEVTVVRWGAGGRD
jgi:hypothetical protein